MEKIREGYLALSKRDPERWLVIECSSESSEEIFEKMVRLVSSRRILSDK